MNSLKKLLFVTLIVSIAVLVGANESVANESIENESTENGSLMNEIPVDASITPRNQTVKQKTNVRWDVRFGGGNNYYYNYRFNYGDGGYNSGASYERDIRFTKTGGFTLGSGTQRTFTQSLTVSSGSTNATRTSSVLVQR